MNCKNCQVPLSEDAKFCENCGAKVIDHRLTLKYLWGEFTEKYFNIDNTLLRTFLHLFTKPDEVIGGYINGVRKKYVNAISYYSIALTIAGVQIFILRKFFPESLDISVIVPENNPQANMDMEWTYDYYTILALINIPIYALMARLTFYGIKKLNFTEHLVTMAYIFGQFTLFTFPIVMVSVMLGGNFYITSYSLFPLLFIYTVYSYKKLYKMGMGAMALRSFLFIFIAIVLLIAIGILQLIFLLINGDFQQMLDAQKAKQTAFYIASSVMNWTS